MHSSDGEIDAEQANAAALAAGEDGAALSTAWLPLASVRGYFRYHLKSLPFAYRGMDSQRVTMAHFALAALDLLQPEPQQPPQSDSERQRLVSWLYAMQVGGGDGGGFRGSPCSAVSSCFASSPAPPSCSYDHAHLASTYSALISLLVLGDDLSRVRRSECIGLLRRLQRADGCFDAGPACDESDLRFVYCAAAVCRLLGQECSAVFDSEAAVCFVLRCQSYEGGFGMQPGNEAHGGATYLALASLQLMRALHRLQAGGAAQAAGRRLLRWCLHRQPTAPDGGYSGRSNKPADVCYGFWLGASLQLLQAADSTSAASNLRHLRLCLDQQRGGFCKERGGLPDLLHSYFAVAAMACIRQSTPQQQADMRLQAIDAALGLALPRIPH